MVLWSSHRRAALSFLLCASCVCSNGVSRHLQPCCHWKPPGINSNTVADADTDRLILTFKQGMGIVNKSERLSCTPACGSPELAFNPHQPEKCQTFGDGDEGTESRVCWPRFILSFDCERAKDEPRAPLWLLAQMGNSQLQKLFLNSMQFSREASNTTEVFRKVLCASPSLTALELSHLFRGEILLPDCLWKRENL